MASVATKDKPPMEGGMQQIDLTTLSMPQLAQLKQNLEQVSHRLYRKGHFIFFSNEFFMLLFYRISNFIKSRYRL